VDEDDLIIFGDAFDVFYVGTEEQLVDQFLKWDLGADNVVFMAEKGCWPYLDGRPNGRHICNNVYPSSPTPNRYLNSGVSGV
jgi:hypothetical protein